VKYCCVIFWFVVWVVCTGYSISWLVGPVGIPQSVTTAEEAHPNGIENYYGIMWWGKGDVLHPIINNVTGLGFGPSKYFDPNKPTLIYSHGYQPGAGESARRERLTSFDGVLMADAWIEAGWNVGSFYWTQFADEPNVEGAEAKIWPLCLPVLDVCDAPYPMRWKKKDGTFVKPLANSIPSVSDLLYESIVASTEGANPEKGFKLRLVGHSLGGSVVIGASYRLAAAADAGIIPSYLKPERVSMLDPFWTPAHARDVFQRLLRMRYVHNVTQDMSRTSVFSAPAGYGKELLTTPNSQLTTAFVWQDAKFISSQNGYFAGATAGAAKHMSSKAFYFLSIDPKNPNKEIGPSAVTNDQVVKDFAVSGYYWKQVKGFYTESILDDVYEKLSWHHDPLPNHDGDAEGTIAIWVLINVLFLVLTCCCGICFCTWCLGKRKRLKFDDIEKMNNVADRGLFSIEEWGC
jgi:hypothetical protein